MVTFLDNAEAGKQVRRYIELELERSEVSMLPLNWNLVHRINEKVHCLQWI